jgi:hypothetical protein
LRTFAAATAGLLALALVGQATSPSAAESSPWKIDEQPALAPGDIPSWDDFAIRDVAILRFKNKWMMLYKGISLSEDERVCALGIAESANGLAWRKSLAESAIPVKIDEEPSSPCLVLWNDGFLAAYVVHRLPHDDEESDRIAERVELASSNDGSVWQPLGALAGLSFKRPDFIFLRISLYADGGRLHLWWIGINQESKPALCHSVSRDGLTWSNPNMQPAAAIDSREILGARVYPSGDFFILVYLASDGPSKAEIVTKISRDAVTWQTKGPPEFVLPTADSMYISMPEMIFTPEGARLFYSETQLGESGFRGAVLRTAFCPKSGYAK